MRDSTMAAEPANYDYSRLPSGEREWSEFIAYVSVAGGLAERHFIELKSDIDPTGKEGAAKVAKYILGTANRDPARASRYFEGRAVMVLGVAKDDICGLERFEAKDFVGAVQQYVGDPGPHWDYHRIPINNERDVVVVTVEAPRPGHPMWPCCREGVGLKDGRIYVRADGETREANSGEIRVLIERAAAKAMVSPDLDVRIYGSVYRIAGDISVCDEYVAEVRSRLEAVAPGPPAPKSPPSTKPPTSPAASVANYGPHWPAMAGFMPPMPDVSLGSMFLPRSEPDIRSRDEYLEEIDEWEQEFRSAWNRFVLAFAVATTPTIGIGAVSQTYVEEVKVKIHLDGPVHARDQGSDAYPDFDDVLPPPPESWGPRTVDPLPRSTIAPELHLPHLSPRVAPAIYSRYGNIDFDNSGSVNLSTMFQELRPQEPDTSHDDVLLTVPGDCEGDVVTGTWTVTARRYDRQYSGELQVDIELRDLTASIREYLWGTLENDG